MNEVSEGTPSYTRILRSLINCQRKFIHSVVYSLCLSLSLLIKSFSLVLIAPTAIGGALSLRMPNHAVAPKLNDLVFKVYNNSDNPIVINGKTIPTMTTSGKDAAYICDMVFDNNTKIASLPSGIKGELPLGTYWIEEASTDATYHITWQGDNFSIKESDLPYKKGDEILGNTTHFYEYGKAPANKVKRAGVSVTKISDELSEPQGDGNFSATFEITNLSEKAVVVPEGGQVFPPNSVITTATIVTDPKTGEGNTGVVLPVGKYRITEVKPATGLLMDNTESGSTPWSKEFEITEEDEGKILKPFEPVENIQIRGGFSIKKSDENRIKTAPQGDEDEPQGNGSFHWASFKVVNMSTEHQPVLVNGTLYPYGATVFTFTTEEDGTYTSDIDLLPYGTYWIYETDASEGYDIDEAWVGKVEVYKHHEIHPANDYTVNPICEPIKRGGVTVQKFDDELARAYSQGMATIWVLENLGSASHERHVLVTDPNGQFLSTYVQHSVETNRKAKAIFSIYPENLQRSTANAAGFLRLCCQISTYT